MKILFDVPVYRLTKEEYETQQDAYIDQNISDGNYYVQKMYRREPDVKRQTENYLWESYGGGWLFNEVIGFIRLFFLSTQIRGEYWPVTVKRIKRGRRKVFRPCGYEVTHGEKIPQGSSSQEIFNLILKFLARVNREKELKNCHIYTSLLKNIGMHMDWNALLEEQFRRKTPSDSC